MLLSDLCPCLSEDLGRYGIISCTSRMPVSSGTWQSQTISRVNQQPVLLSFYARVIRALCSKLFTVLHIVDSTGPCPVALWNSSQPHPPPPKCLCARSTTVPRKGDIDNLFIYKQLFFLFGLVIILSRKINALGSTWADIIWFLDFLPTTSS